jgi:hypothetical protein
MGGIRTFWQRGWTNKIIIVVAGLCSTMMFCCVALVALAAINPGKSQGSTPTAVAQSLAVHLDDKATATPEPSATPQPSATRLPTNTAIPSPAVALPTATAQPTDSPTAAPTSTPTDEPTATPKPTAAPKPTAKPKPTAIPLTIVGVRIGAICRDGTRSNATGRGACSHHGGVDHWLYR